MNYRQTRTLSNSEQVIPIRLRWWWRRHLPRQSRCSTVESVGIAYRWLATWHVVLYAVGHHRPTLGSMRQFPSVPLAVPAELDTTVQPSSRRREPPSSLPALVAKDWCYDKSSRTDVRCRQQPLSTSRWHLQILAEQGTVLPSLPLAALPRTRTFLTCSSYRHFDLRHSRSRSPCELTMQSNFIELLHFF